MTASRSAPPDIARSGPEARPVRPGLEAVIAGFSSRQHGVVTRQQLLSGGVGPDVVDRQLKKGRLRRIHQGVYHVGPTAGPYARQLAACLACGSKAVLSHRNAGALWDDAAGNAPSVVDIILSEGNRRRPGIRIHRMPDLRSDERTRLDGIPITTPVRTLCDLAGSAGTRELEGKLAEWTARGLVRPNQLRTLLERHPRKPGIGLLRELLEAGEPALTRSEAEEQFLALIRRAGLASPRVNARAAGYEVDFLWPSERLVVEIDGFAFHSSRSAFERDRRRDAKLTAEGLRVIRVTWRQIMDEREAVLVRLTQALRVEPRA